MKTMNYLWAALTAAALSLSACRDNEVTNGNDDNAYPHEQVALSFNVDATVGITTRADDSSDHVTVPGNAFPRRCNGRRILRRQRRHPGWAGRQQCQQPVQD